MESPLEHFTRANVLKMANELVGEYMPHSQQDKFYVQEHIKHLVRSMAKDLKRHHDQGHCVSSFNHWNIEISESGRARIIGVTSVDKNENSIRQNYKDLHNIVLNTIFRDFSLQHQLPSDWRSLLLLMKMHPIGNEYLICNYVALMPIENRVFFFHKAYEHVRFVLAQTDPVKQRRIYNGLPYSRRWWDILRGNLLLEASFAHKKHDISGEPEGFFDFYRHTNSHRMDRYNLIPSVGAYTPLQFEMNLAVRYPLYLAELEELLHQEGELMIFLEPHLLF